MAVLLKKLLDDNRDEEYKRLLQAQPPRLSGPLAPQSLYRLS
jgi:hypothetical protein